MKNILVPHDLSPNGAPVLAKAQMLASALGAKLWLIHVAAPDPDFVGFETGPRSIRDHRADRLRSEHQELQTMAQLLRSDGLDAEALLVQGPTTATILDEARRLNADIIVMGSHGHSALYKAFVGSVCEQVLAESTIPILVVPIPRNT
ncbi:MAG: universal stress protein [Flavobacteriales bacterium]|jgi:nucleotide-binding universal stress UspA family protein|nr:universal stress protein [Flavobacteriales bacterium]HOZ40011.1 universal stress protein [Flavobacteriales bacterium]